MYASTVGDCRNFEPEPPGYQPLKSQLPHGACQTLATIKYELKSEAFEWTLQDHDIDLFLSKMTFFTHLTSPTTHHTQPEEAIQDDDFADRYDGDMIISYVLSLIVMRYRRDDSMSAAQWQAESNHLLSSQITIFESDCFMMRSATLKKYPTNGTIDICWVDNKRCYGYPEGPVIDAIDRFRTDQFGDANLLPAG